MTKRGSTLGDLFPGNLGRLALSTVVLRLKRPELLRLPMDEPVSEELAEELRRALRNMKDQQ